MSGGGADSRKAVKTHDFVEACWRGVRKHLMGAVAVELEAGHELRGLNARSGESAVAAVGSGDDSAGQSGAGGAEDGDRDEGRRTRPAR